MRPNSTRQVAGPMGTGQCSVTGFIRIMNYFALLVISGVFITYDQINFNTFI